MLVKLVAMIQKIPQTLMKLLKFVRKAVGRQDSLLLVLMNELDAHLAFSETSNALKYESLLLARVIGGAELCFQGFQDCLLSNEVRIDRSWNNPMNVF
jgi:hypothetical protein